MPNIRVNLCNLEIVEKATRPPKNLRYLGTFELSSIWAARVAVRGSLDVVVALVLIV